MDRLNKIKVIALGISLLIVFCDQITKSMALSNFEYVTAYPIFKLVTEKLNFGMNWFLTFNYGTAFSFIQSASGYKYTGLVICSILVTIFLFYWLIKEQDYNRTSIIAVGMIIGGALGNIYDRLSLGYVVDFIDVYAGHLHWPVFNVADMAISVGVMLLIWQVLFVEQKSS